MPKNIPTLRECLALLSECEAERKETTMSEDMSDELLDHKWIDDLESKIACSDGGCELLFWNKKNGGIEMEIRVTKSKRFKTRAEVLRVLDALGINLAK